MAPLPRQKEDHIIINLTTLGEYQNTITCQALIGRKTQLAVSFTSFDLTHELDRILFPVNLLRWNTHIYKIHHKNSFLATNRILDLATDLEASSLSCILLHDPGFSWPASLHCFLHYKHYGANIQIKHSCCYSSLIFSFFTILTNYWFFLTSPPFWARFTTHRLVYYAAHFLNEVDILYYSHHPASVFYYISIICVTPSQNPRGEATTCNIYYKPVRNPKIYVLRLLDSNIVSENTRVFPVIKHCMQAKNTVCLDCPSTPSLPNPARSNPFTRLSIHFWSASIVIYVLVLVHEWTTSLARTNRFIRYPLFRLCLEYQYKTPSLPAQACNHTDSISIKRSLRLRVH